MTYFAECIQRQIDASYNKATRDWRSHTIGDFIGAVLAIDNEEDAKRFYESAVEFETDRFRSGQEDTPEHVVRANIGWCFGEGMAAEMIAAWKRATNAFHPAGIA